MSAEIDAAAGERRDLTCLCVGHAAARHSLLQYITALQLRHGLKVVLRGTGELHRAQRVPPPGDPAP